MLSIRKAILMASLVPVLLFAARTALAHPHVYVDASLTFSVDEKGLTSIREHWFFDEIFTNAILTDLGLSPETLKSHLGQRKIHDGAFTYLANFQYFTYVQADGKVLPIKKAEDFHASLSGPNLVYEFTVPLHLPFDRIKDFRAAVFDKEYYTDILLKKDEIAFEVDGAAKISHTIRPANDLKYWQFIVPQAIHLTVTPPGVNTEGAPEALEPVPSPGPMERLMTLVREVQKEITLKLNGFGLDIRGNPLGRAFWLFLAFSFLYGIVHAVGPGHGKTVVCSYFMANPGSLLTGAIMGNAITFVHMGSAALAVSMAYLVFSTGLGGFAETSRHIQPASYALLALMGLFLTAKALYDLFRGSPAVSGCDQVIDGAGNIRRILLVSLVTGLIPCPGAAVILAFAIGQKILWAGLLALVAMAIGMGITTTLFAWAAVAARMASFKASSINPALARWMNAGLSISGGAVIAVFGAVLFMSSTGWHQIFSLPQ